MSSFQKHSPTTRNPITTFIQSQNIHPSQKLQILFTDGSATATGNGASMYNSTTKTWTSDSLLSTWSKYTTELYAIRQALKSIQYLTHTTTFIFSDSKAALTSLSFPNCSSHIEGILVNCWHLINNYQSKPNNIIKLIWIPGMQI